MYFDCLAYSLEGVVVAMGKHTEKDTCEHITATGGGHTSVTGMVHIDTSVRTEDMGVVCFLDNNEIVLAGHYTRVGFAE